MFYVLDDYAVHLITFHIKTFEYIYCQDKLITFGNSD